MSDKSRLYLQSHAFLTFVVDLRRVDPMFWLQLGETQSKCDHISGVPLKPKVAEQLHLLYLAKGIQATVAIEGNTLTEQQVAGVLAGQHELPPSQEYLATEARNISDATGIIVRDLVAGGDMLLTVARLKEFNKLVFKDLEVPPHVLPGETRTSSVGVGSYRGAPWEDCEHLMDRLVTWLNSDVFQAPTPDLEIAYATIKAVLAHLYIAWIHPFGDGNGRTARLVELQILTAAGAPTPAAHLLSNHYNQTRAEYYRQLDRASSTGDPIPFLQYAVRGFVDGLRAQLALIREQQLSVAWESYVYETRDGGRSTGETRRKHLLLDLHRLGPTPLQKLRELSPRVAAHYATLTPRTLIRDVGKLHSEQLITINKEGEIVANMKVIQAFLPMRRKKPSN